MRSGRSLEIEFVGAGGKLTAAPVVSGGGLRRCSRPRRGRTGPHRPGSAPRREAAAPRAPHPGRAAAEAGVGAALRAPRPRPQVCAPALRWGGDALALPRPVAGPSRLLSHVVLGGRALRFDPTAFVKAKERKQREIKMKSVPLPPSPAPVPGPCPLPGAHLSTPPSVPISFHLLASRRVPRLLCRLRLLCLPSVPPPRLCFCMLSAPRLVTLGGRRRGCDLLGRSDTLARRSWAYRPVSPFFFPRQQQRNRLGSGGSGDGPSVSWSRQTRAPAVVTGRGDAPNRSRNRSSSGNPPGARGRGARRNCAGVGGTGRGRRVGRGGAGRAGRAWEALGGASEGQSSRPPSPSSG